MISNAVKEGYITPDGYGLRCERIVDPSPVLGCTGSTAQRRRVTRIAHHELYRLPNRLGGGEGDLVRALVGNILEGFGIVLFGLPVLTLGNSDIGFKANITLRSRFLNYGKCTGIPSGAIGQAVHQAGHLRAFDLIAAAVKCSQCGILGYIQRGQLIHIAVKPCQGGILGYIQGRQLIVVAVELCQGGILGYVQCGQLIVRAIKVGYIAPYGNGLRCEFIGYPFIVLGCTVKTAQRRRVTRIDHMELYLLPDLLRGGEGDHVCRSAA